MRAVESNENETGGGRESKARVSKDVNERVWKKEIRCKLRKNSKSLWSSRLLNRVGEHSNVIPSQFHNPSISATLFPAHPLNALTVYLFNTVWCTVGGSRGRHADTEGNKRRLGSVHTEQCPSLYVSARGYNLHLLLLWLLHFIVLSLYVYVCVCVFPLVSLCLFTGLCALGT